MGVNVALIIMKGAIDFLFAGLILPGNTINVQGLREIFY